MFAIERNQLSALILLRAVFGFYNKVCGTTLERPLKASRVTTPLWYNGVCSAKKFASTRRSFKCLATVVLVRDGIERSDFLKRPNNSKAIFSTMSKEEIS